MATVFLSRITTVDMVLWDGTRMVPCDSQLWGNSVCGIATGTTEIVAMAGKFDQMSDMLKC